MFFHKAFLLKCILLKHVGLIPLSAQTPLSLLTYIAIIEFFVCLYGVLQKRGVRLEKRIDDLHQ